MRSCIQIVLIFGWLAVAPAHGALLSDPNSPFRNEVTALAVKLGQGETVAAGTVAGHPYLGNGSVLLVWDKPESGAGLVSMYDVTAKKELLRVDSGKATLWEIFVKRGKDKVEQPYSNVGASCEVTSEVVDGEGRVMLRWSDPLAVEVETGLGKGESLARSRIRVKTKREDEGLLTVTFPRVSGVLPLTSGAKQDEVLIPFRLGWTKPSPLLSGKPLAFRYGTSASLQLTALMGAGRGLYFAEEDPEANWKDVAWTPADDKKTLGFSIGHPVLNWGGDEPVGSYSSPGDVVMGPFQGDWFDVARIYRKWAITAPWCRKGTIPQRKDYPQWLARVPYWTNGGLSDETGIEREIIKQEFFGLPESLCHDYYYMFHYYQHDRNPEYFPPRIGSENYKRLIKDFHKRGIRVVPYVIGWLWNMSTESYRTEEVERRGVMKGEKGAVLWTWAGGLDPQAAMCPATKLWRDKLTEVSKTFIGTYGMDGVYFDYFTQHINDCFVKEHGHPIGGGNYWSKSVHDLYAQIRAECRKINPEAMLCGEDAAEWCIDVLDTSYEAGPYSNAPVFLAVYHGYTQVFGGGIHNKTSPPYQGKYWLMGCQNGRSNQEGEMARPNNDHYRRFGRYYRDLIRCHWEFARPYLGYGEMLRPPKIEGDIPTVTQKGGYGPFTLPVVDGTAWLADDGTVGIFFLNYDKEKEFEFRWTHDLGEIAGIGGNRKLKMTRWTPDGIEAAGECRGGVLRRTMKIGSWGMIALKLEVVR